MPQPTQVTIDGNQAAATIAHLTDEVITTAHETSLQVEERYIAVQQSLQQQVTIPITMKLSSQFTSLVHFVKRLSEAGAAGVAIFNRFYQPDINLETLRVEPRLLLSSSQESLLRIRWTAILYGQVKCSLAVTGGLHTLTLAIAYGMAGRT